MICDFTKLARAHERWALIEANATAILVAALLSAISNLCYLLFEGSIAVLLLAMNAEMAIWLAMGNRLLYLITEIGKLFLVVAFCFAVLRAYKVAVGLVCIFFVALLYGALVYGAFATFMATRKDASAGFYLWGGLGYVLLAYLIYQCFSASVSMLLTRGAHIFALPFSKGSGWLGHLLTVIKAPIIVHQAGIQALLVAAIFVGAYWLVAIAYLNFGPYLLYPMITYLQISQSYIDGSNIDAFAEAALMAVGSAAFFGLPVFCLGALLLFLRHIRLVKPNTVDYIGTR